MLWMVQVSLSLLPCMTALLGQAHGAEIKTGEMKLVHSQVTGDLAERRGEAQRKFGNAKSISSAQYYGHQDREEYEIKARLDRYQGSSSLSSADLFGNDQRTSKAGASGSFSGADLSQLKDGVVRVTGKLSSMASGVIGTLQNRYSGSS
ncbi:ADP-ribosylation factor GTPase-activating protein 3 [Acropora cervicornis]|uniref:ADP-ribosylation factor GTPase-activating protein 3 n=1 Tax=Acropora cervicornis TaxID=6130 RepID=A0AAD9V7B2_ACRCE|nr:ADP-ribosylation factor GTPase-activating protein 3 [Acropora cervicornis]